ncbi:unnamed protein product [Chrysoparadoxa australica]
MPPPSPFESAFGCFRHICEDAADLAAWHSRIVSMLMEVCPLEMQLEHALAGDWCSTASSSSGLTAAVAEALLEAHSLVPASCPILVAVLLRKVASLPSHPTGRIALIEPRAAKTLSGTVVTLVKRCPALPRAVIRTAVRGCLEAVMCRDRYVGERERDERELASRLEWKQLYLRQALFIQSLLAMVTLQPQPLQPIVLPLLIEAVARDSSCKATVPGVGELPSPEVRADVATRCVLQWLLEVHYAKLSCRASKAVRHTVLQALGQLLREWAGAGKEGREPPDGVILLGLVLDSFISEASSRAAGDGTALLKLLTRSCEAELERSCDAPSLLWLSIHLCHCWVLSRDQACHAMRWLLTAAVKVIQQCDEASGNALGNASGSLSCKSALLSEVISLVISRRPELVSIVKQEGMGNLLDIVFDNDVVIRENAAEAQAAQAKARARSATEGFRRRCRSALPEAWQHLRSCGHAAVHRGGVVKGWRRLLEVPSPVKLPRPDNNFNTSSRPGLNAGAFLAMELVAVEVSSFLGAKRLCRLVCTNKELWRVLGGTNSCRNVIWERTFRSMWPISPIGKDLPKKGHVVCTPEGTKDRCIHPEPCPLISYGSDSTHSALSMLHFDRDWLSLTQQRWVSIRTVRRLRAAGKKWKLCPWLGCNQKLKPSASLPQHLKSHWLLKGRNPQKLARKGKKRKSPEAPG